MGMRSCIRVAYIYIYILLRKISSDITKLVLMFVLYMLVNSRPVLYIHTCIYVAELCIYNIQLIWILCCNMFVPSELFGFIILMYKERRKGRRKREEFSF